LKREKKKKVEKSWKMLWHEIFMLGVSKGFMLKIYRFVSVLPFSQRFGSLNSACTGSSSRIGRCIFCMFFFNFNSIQFNSTSKGSKPCNHRGGRCNSLYSHGEFVHNRRLDLKPLYLCFRCFKNTKKKHQSYKTNQKISELSLQNLTSQSNWEFLSSKTGFVFEYRWDFLAILLIWWSVKVGALHLSSNCLRRMKKDWM
jgi:hypothetical protein